MSSQIISNIIHQFRRFKLASTLNLAGLCIALATFFLFLTKVEENVQYNTCFKNWERMYRIELRGKIFLEQQDSMATIFEPVRDIALKIPHVEDAALKESSNRVITMKKHDEEAGIDKEFKLPYLDGYAEQLKFFGIELVDSLKEHKDSTIIVPASFAQEMYGTTHISGKEISWTLNSEKYTRLISGVYKDFPSNCLLKNGFYQYGPNRDKGVYTNFMYQVYVLVDSPDNIPQIEHDLLHKITQVANDHFQLSFNDTSSLKVKLQQIQQTYFSNVDKITDKGNWIMVTIVFFSALLFIVLTNVNFMNFTLANVPIRMKNINTRRVLGASRKSIIIHLMTESILLSLFAFGISMASLYALSHFVGNDISPFAHMRILFYTFILSIVIALVSSTYPAVYSTSFAPDIAIKGTFGLTMTSRRLRVIRIGFQFFICSVAMTTSLMLFIQKNFIFNTEYGFIKNRTLYGELTTKEAKEHKEDIRKAIEQIKEVKSVSYSTFEIGSTDRYFLWALKTTDNKYNVMSTVIPIDNQYIKTLGIKITEGTSKCNPDSGAFILSKAAKEKFPWTKVGGHLLPYDNDPQTSSRIIGFCDNIIFSSLRFNHEIEPLIFYIPPKDMDYNSTMNTINIRVSEDANVESIKDKVNAVYRSYINNESIGEQEKNLSLRLLNDDLPNLYQSELEFLSQTSIIAVIYIIITLIGTFCITLFDCEYHRKEIGIRKVFGATTFQIITMINKKYLIIAVCSFIASVPFSYILGEKLMTHFKLQSSYIDAAYPIALAIITLAIVGTVSIQSIRASKFKIQN